MICLYSRLLYTPILYATKARARPVPCDGGRAAARGRPDTTTDNVILYNNDFILCN